MTRYHWFVLAVAAMGWLFDTMDQQLFVLARPAAMVDLIPAVSSSDSKTLDMERRRAGDYATSIFIAGWAAGGLFFGMLGDRIGRARTMVITVLLYSIFTGLSSFSRTPWDFAGYRFLTGLGVGGEFAVGVALRGRSHARRGAAVQSLALLQALSGIGNVTAAFIFLGLGVVQEQGWLAGWQGHSIFGSPWRIMFVIGAVPAFLAFLIMRRLKEPERWERASHEGGVAAQLGSYRSLFREPLLRKHALLGLLLGCAGVIGLWSVGFYTFDLIRFVQRQPVTTQRLSRRATRGPQQRGPHAGRASRGSDQSPTRPGGQPAERAGGSPRRIEQRRQRTPQPVEQLRVDCHEYWCRPGNVRFRRLAQRIGRKPTFVIAFLAAFVSTFAVFYFLNDFWQIWVMVPVMGFCQLSLFAGYAIYFPELFPTRLRSREQVSATTWAASSRRSGR